MNILNITAFLSIIGTGSVTKAAQELYVTQSTVSHRLKALEEELNTTLIIRKKGHQTISLTAKGEDFIPIAERWLALWKDTNLLQHSEGRLSLSVASVDSLNVYLFPPLYQQLLSHKRPIDLRIRTHQSGEIYHLLDEREIDVGFALRQILYKNIIIEPILQEKMVLIQRTTETSSSALIHPHELNPEKEFFIDWSPAYRSWHDYWWDSSIRPHIHIDTAAMILRLMDDPTYWSIIPLSMAQDFCQFANFQIHEIQEPPPDRIVYKLTHKYPKPGSVPAINILETYVKEFAANRSK